MVPRRTPRKDRGPRDFTAVGKKGRRTGVELKDTGIRDENGIEPIPSFSSPAKSGLQPKGITHDATYSADDSMDIDQSTLPEPTDVLRSVRNGRISLPPRATSPIKTHLNSSPRRSMARSVGPMSSPSRNLNNGTSTRAVSHPPNSKPVNRQLDFSMEELHRSIEYSPQKGPASMRPPKLPAAAGKGKNKRAFDLSVGADDPEESESDALNGATTTNGIDYDDEELLPNGDDQIMFDQSLDHGALGEDYNEQQAKGLGDEDSEMVEQGPKLGAKDGKRKGGRRAPTAVILAPAESEVGTPRRGRPPKKSKPPVFRDPDAGPAAAPSKIAGNIRKPPPKQRDPNTKITNRGSTKSPSIRSASIGPRSTFLQRSETPANDDGALVTRSGRHSFKPLKSWLGEKFTMGDRTVDALPAIKEVVRVEEVIEPRPQRSGHRKPKRRVRSQLSDVEEEEDEEDGKDDWELDDGIKVAEVMDWDPDTNKYDEGNTREEDVAYSFDAIEMRDIAGAEFKFAKTLTLDFFGAGMVEVPPGGAKRIKNSRKMQMVFFVFYGRVTVNIGTPPTRFSIGKGGQWHVPRGNFYSISNESDTKSARIFFAQGCETQAETGAVDESTMA